MLEKIIMALKDTRELLSKDDHWARKSFAYDANWRPVDSTSPDAVCWCMVGAVCKVAAGRGVVFPTLAALADVVEQKPQGWRSVPEGSPSDKLTAFNDDDMTSHHHVIEVFDEAIANLERSMKDG